MSLVGMSNAGSASVSSMLSVSFDVVEGLSALPCMFAHLAGCITLHSLYPGFYKLVGHDSESLMLGPSVNTPGSIGLFVDSYRPGLSPFGVRDCLPAGGVYQDGDVITVYGGRRVRVCDMTSEQLLSRYTFRNGHTAPYVTVGSPDGSCYAAFANEGFG